MEVKPKISSLVWTVRLSQLNLKLRKKLSFLNNDKYSYLSSKKPDKKEEHQYKLINPEDKIRKILILAEEKKKSRLQTLIQ